MDWNVVNAFDCQLQIEFNWKLAQIAEKYGYMVAERSSPIHAGYFMRLLTRTTFLSP